jgi:hypothetical protein
MKTLIHTQGWMGEEGKTREGRKTQLPKVSSMSLDLGPSI